MNAHTTTGTATGDAVSEAGGLLVSLGIVTMVFFPFAIPGVVLAVVAVLPLLVLGLVAALVAVVVALPIVAVRRMRGRRATRASVGAAPSAGLHGA